MTDHDRSSTELAVLAAKQTIAETLHRYCRGVDRMDRDLVLSCWHDGGTADYGDAYRGSALGFVDWLWPVHASFHAHSHQLANVLIEIAGDRAVSESYVTVVLRAGVAPDGLVDLVDRGRYLDRWSRRTGRWAIEHRQHLSDVSSMYTVLPGGGGGHGPARRNPSDPSYDVFGDAAG